MQKQQHIAIRHRESIRRSDLQLLKLYLPIFQKYKTLTFLLIVLVNTIFAQYQPRYSHYMFTQALYNPAYNGVHENLSGVLVYRQQWTGIQGAPITQGGNVGYALNNHHTIGMSILQDKIGVTNDLNFTAAYAFKARFSNDNYLSLGLDLTLQQHTDNFSNVLTTSPNDHVFAQSNNLIYARNMGFGLYYSSQKFFVGLSTPLMFQHAYEYSTGGNATYESGFSFAAMHYFLTAGYIMPLNENSSFFPTFLVKQVDGGPMQIDLNANFTINESFWLGAGYRTEGAAVFTAGIAFLNKYRLVYSFDATLSKLNSAAGGTHEITLGFGYPLYTSPFGTSLKRRYLKKDGSFKGM